MLKFSENPLVNIGLNILLIVLVIGLISFYFPIYGAIGVFLLLVLLILRGMTSTSKSIAIIEKIMGQSDEWIFERKRKGIRIIKGLRCYLKSYSSIEVFFDINTADIRIKYPKISGHKVIIVRKPDRIVKYETLNEIEENDSETRLKIFCFVTNSAYLTKKLADFTLTVFDYPTVFAVNYTINTIIIKNNIPEIEQDWVYLRYIKQLEDLIYHLDIEVRQLKTNENND